MRLMQLALLAPLVLWTQVQAQSLEPATPESQGMDSAALAQLVEFGGNAKMDSLVVVRNGRVVTEAYYAPFRKEMLHRINSSTKAVAGALAGIAIARGDLPGTDISVHDLFGEAAPADGRWKAVKLQHLLDMTSGMEWSESLGDMEMRSVRELERSGNWAQFILERNIRHTPGLVFNYNSGGPHLVTLAIARKTGIAPDAYAAKHLFEPIGIHDHRWRRDPQGVALGGWGVYLHARDMARFGVLYLHGGQWDGRQVIPRSWVERVFSPKVEMDFPGFRYADFWWSIPGRKAYFASGLFGQVIMVLPELGVVAATTGRQNYGVGELITHLERAARPNAPLPENAAAQAALRDKIAAAAVERPWPQAQVVQSAVQRGTWQLEANPLGVRELTLDFTSPQPTYKAKLRSREVSAMLGMDGRFAQGNDGGTPVFSRARWVDPATLEVEQRWPEEGNEMSITFRFDGQAMAFTYSSGFGQGTVRGQAAARTPD